MCETRRDAVVLLGCAKSCAASDCDQPQTKIMAGESIGTTCGTREQTKCQYFRSFIRPGHKTTEHVPPSTRLLPTLKCPALPCPNVAESKSQASGKWQADLSKLHYIMPTTIAFTLYLFVVFNIPCLPSPPWHFIIEYRVFFCRILHTHFYLMHFACICMSHLSKKRRAAQRQCWQRQYFKNPPCLQ